MESRGGLETRQPGRRISLLMRAILTAGLIAGTLDILDAFIFYGFRGVSPVRILQSIAAGLLGRASFQGGAKTALLGAALHYLIAFTATILFFLISRRLPFARQHAIISGLLYGAGVYAFMNLIVLLLSKAGQPAFFGWPFVNGVLAVVLLVGLPISLICKAFSGIR